MTKDSAPPMNESFDQLRFDEALSKFDQRNAADPARASHQGKNWPKCELYGRRMSEWLSKIEPLASEELRLAVRAQHLARHEMPRNEFPQGRTGYLRWRIACKTRHAELAAEILSEVGYEQDRVQRVRHLIEKRDLKRNKETQALEDTACLVFLEDHLVDFAQTQDEDKLLTILRKTWHKMSERGHQAALSIEMEQPLLKLLERALETDRS